MLRPRIIPTLLMANGELFKTKKFRSRRNLGDPLNTVRIFNDLEADEIVILDIDASRRGAKPDLGLVSRLAAQCRMPVCYGGGITELDDARRIIENGVEKVAIGAAALNDHLLVSRISERFGAQSVCVIIDVGVTRDGRYEILAEQGTRFTGRNPLTMAQAMEKQGAGEILFNFVHRDGMCEGYDLAFARMASDVLHCPLTMLGGAGSITDIENLFRISSTIGAAAGSLFVYKGALSAVLINYPEQDRRDALAHRVMAEPRN